MKYGKAPILALAAGLLCATSMMAHAQQTTVASWYFGRVTPGQPVSPNTEFSGSSLSLYPASNTTLWGTNLDAAHPYSLDFPGWLEINPDLTVDRTASMLSSDPNFASSAIGGSEAPGVVTIDPESAPFLVSAWIQPEKASLYPLGTRQPGEISPNIVQKGRSGEVGGFWKVSLGLNRSSTGQMRWFPFCTFKGANAEQVEPGFKNKPAEGKVRYYLADGDIVRLECIKQGATGILKVYKPGISAPVFTASETAAGVTNFHIQNDAALSVGHKPRTTDPADIYSGVLDNLVIKKN